MGLRRIPLLAALAAVSSAVIAQAPPDLVGFAAVDADGLSATTGGDGGRTVTASGFAELAEFAAGSEPRVIQVTGTISGSGMVRLGSNKTLIGLGKDALLEGFGIHIAGEQNIIIRNLSFVGSGDDAINIQDASHHVWIDHCDLSFAADGLIDIKRGSSWITVSWNHFYDHQKTCLLGHSDDNGKEDIGRLKVTYHHNWFDRTGSRHPRARFGECHVFNNFYDRVRSYGVASTQNADVLVERNYFLRVDEPTLVGYAASGPGDLAETGNLFVSSGAPETAGVVFDPSAYYAYDADPPADVPSIVTAGAGVAGFTPPAGAAFVRGETNGDGWFDIGDPVSIVLYLFRGKVLDCEKTADANYDGSIAISDVVYLLQFLFLGGPPPDLPFPDCGVDPAHPEIPCTEYPSC